MKIMKFDTRDKKPRIWNVAILSAVTVVVVTVLTALPGNEHILTISLILAAYFACVIVMLITAFFRQLQYNPYSYNVIYYLSFSLFVISVLAFLVLSMTRTFSGSAEPDIKQILTVLSGAARNFLVLISIYIIPFSVALAISNIILIIHEGFRPVNALGIFLGIFLAGGLMFMRRYGQNFSGNLEQLTLHGIVMTLVTSFYLYFECMMIGTAAAVLIAAFYEPEPDKDIVIILGYSLRDGEKSAAVLRERVDRAIAFRKKQLGETGKELTFITSGGKGTEEAVSESRWMHDYLTQQGIPEELIVEEDQATTTHENMIFSKKKIQEINPKAKIAFSTSNYHVFRSGLYARREKMRAVGMGARTKWYFWPNASVREFAGILSEHRLKQAIILCGLIALNLILVLLAYYA
jgi:uncharacterized SAM-binding protein YcdF (DUF218 family)